MEYLNLFLGLILPVIKPIILFALVYYSGKVFWSYNPIRWFVGWCMVSIGGVPLYKYYPSEEILLLILLTFIAAPLRNTSIHYFLRSTIKSPLIFLKGISPFKSYSNKEKYSYSKMYEDNDQKKSESDEFKKKFKDKEAEFKKKEDEWKKKEKEFEDFKRKSKNTNTQSSISYIKALSIFGISEPFDKRDLNKSYRKLSNQYHPDKNVSATDAVRKLAEEKFKEIKHAYDLIKKMKGF